MSDTDSQTPEQVRPQLWNPNAAANWSLLLTPAFGAYLHAANWRALGNPARARVNMVWFWVTIAFLIVNLGTLFAPETKAIEGIMRLAGLALLLGWYFTQGRSQAKYVKETLHDDYVKKRWGLPLLAGFGAVGAYVAVIFVVAMVAYRPDANSLASQVKPLILQEWQKKPQLQGASIQNVTLAHQGGNVYTGFVDAVFGGQPERLSLEVVVEGGNLRWQVKPLAENQ